MDPCRQQQLIDLTPSSVNHQQEWKATAFILPCADLNPALSPTFWAPYLHRFSISGPTTIRTRFNSTRAMIACHVCLDRKATPVSAVYIFLNWDDTAKFSVTKHSFCTVNCMHELNVENMQQYRNVNPHKKLLICWRLHRHVTGDTLITWYTELYVC